METPFLSKSNALNRIIRLRCGAWLPVTCASSGALILRISPPFGFRRCHTGSLKLATVRVFILERLANVTNQVYPSNPQKAGCSTLASTPLVMSVIGPAASYLFHVYVSTLICYGLISSLTRREQFASIISKVLEGTSLCPQPSH